MGRRVDLTPAPERVVADLLQRAARAGRQQFTSPYGVVDMGLGDTVWSDPVSGEVRSVRETAVTADGALVISEEAQASAVAALGRADVAISDAAQARADAEAATGFASAADAKATQAITSANGRNSRIKRASPPTGTTHPDTGLPLTVGDTWWQIDNEQSQRGIGQWGWDGTAWVPELIGSDVLANLDLLKLTVLGTGMMDMAVVAKIIGDAAAFELLTITAAQLAPDVGPSLDLSGNPALADLAADADLTDLAARVDGVDSSVQQVRNAVVIEPTGITVTDGQPDQNAERIEAGKVGFIAGGSEVAHIDGIEQIMRIRDVAVSGGTTVGRHRIESWSDELTVVRWVG